MSDTKKGVHPRTPKQFDRSLSTGHQTDTMNHPNQSQSGQNSGTSGTSGDTSNNQTNAGGKGESKS